jgi:hypothetical protein
MQFKLVAAANSIQIPAGMEKNGATACVQLRNIQYHHHSHYN